MKPKTKRLFVVLASLLLMSFGLMLILNFFKDQVVFFYAPSELSAGFASGKLMDGQKVRIGGYVQPETIRKDGIKTQFILEDSEEEILVSYDGILPPMFREGQGVVAEGVIASEQERYGLNADRLLTKHDETYKPPEMQRLDTKKSAGNLQVNQP